MADRSAPASAARDRPHTAYGRSLEGHYQFVAFDGFTIVRASVLDPTR